MGRDTTRLDLFMAHRGELLNYANGIVRDRGKAEDVVQEAWLRFHAAPGGFLEEPVGYLYRIVRNLALDGQRRRRLEQRHMAPEAGLPVVERADDAPSPEAALIGRDELARVAKAMAELPERTRRALEMHRLEGCKLKEIAARLGVSISTAQALVIQGVRHCQRRL